VESHLIIEDLRLPGRKRDPESRMAALRTESTQKPDRYGDESGANP
jgi:hypothetical protein